MRRCSLGAPTHLTPTHTPTHRPLAVSPLFSFPGTVERAALTQLSPISSRPPCSSSSAGDKASPDADGPARTASLRKYIETFDSKTLSETASIVSVEGIALVERQTTGLFGSIEMLQRQMQEAVGPVETPQELQRKMAEAVQSGKVAVLTVTYATQRRVILEAVAFGSFLRDVEMKVARETTLLTPTPAGARALGN